MARSHSGDSVGKKLARLEYWLRVRLWLGDEFYAGTHLVLASAVGGDVAVLKALGVEPRKIVAVDRDKRAAEACAEKYPDIDTRVGDAAAVASKLDLASVFLDFCGWGTQADLQTVQRVCLRLRDCAIVGYAFMRGREQCDARKRMLELRGRESQLRLMDARVIGHHLNGSSEPADGRSLRSYLGIQELLVPHRIALFSLSRIYYHSNRGSAGGGVPMVINAKWIYRMPRHSSATAFRRSCSSLTHEWMQVSLAATQLAVADESSTVIEWKRRKVRYPNVVAFDGDYLSMRNLVFNSRQVELEFPDKAHELLNVSKGRLAAWRAHDTRGSYSAGVGA